MPGSFDLDNTTPPLYGDALPTGVYLYDPDADEPFSLFPNVRCLRIDYREGPEPPVARFEYIMDNALAINLGWPSQFEELWPIDAQGPFVVNPDDRLVVMAQNPDGSPMILFDGFAQVPQVNVTPRSQTGDLHGGRRGGPGVGQPGQRPRPAPFRPGRPPGHLGGFRCRRRPAVSLQSGGLRRRQPRRLPAQPDARRRGYRAVARRHLPGPSGLHGPGDRTRPRPRAYWSISDAIKYLLAEYNGSQTYTSYPSLDSFDDLLEVESPPSGQATFDSEDADTSPLTVRDYDASNRPYPEVIADLLSYAGFVMRWDTGADADDLPSTQLRIYRRDGAATSPVKSVYLAAAGAPTLDPSQNNIALLHLARDGNSIVNAWQVETDQRLVEISVILAPLYQPSAGDAQSSARKQFFRSSWNASTTATTRRKYRWYGADECGDGHWTRGGSWSSTPFDFSSVFPPDDDGTAVLHGPVSAGLADADLARQRRQSAPGGPGDQLRL